MSLYYTPMGGAPGGGGVSVSGQVYQYARQACANLLRGNNVPPHIANVFMNNVIAVQANGNGGMVPVNPSGFNKFFEGLYVQCPGLINGSGANINQIQQAAAVVLNEALDAIAASMGGGGDVLIGANTANLPVINNAAPQPVQTIAHGVGLPPYQPKTNQSTPERTATMAVAQQVLSADHTDMEVADLNLITEAPEQVGVSKFATVDWSFRTTSTPVPLRAAHLTLNIPFGNRFTAFRSLVGALPAKALDGKYLFLVSYTQPEVVSLPANNYLTAIQSTRGKDNKLLSPSDIISGLRETLTSRAYEVIDERIVADINAGLYALLRDGYTNEKFAIDKLVDVTELLDRSFSDPLVTQYKDGFFETVHSIAMNSLERYLEEESLCTASRGVSSIVASETTFVDNSGRSKYDLVGANEADINAYVTALSAKQVIVRTARTFIITNLLSRDAQDAVFNGSVLTPRQLPTMNALMSQLAHMADFNRFDYQNLYGLCDRESPADLLLEAVLSTTLRNEVAVIPYLRQLGY